MAEYKGNKSQETAGQGCDVRVWCESCQRSEYTAQGDKYLCTTCGKIAGLEREVHHEHFPHLSGDVDKMS